MSRKRNAVLSAILACAVFYVIFAVGAAFAPDGKLESAVLALAELCASFGGICAMRCMKSRFIPAENGAESEVLSDIEVHSNTEIGEKAVFYRVGSAVFAGTVCAVVLFCGNLLYSRYVYGSSAAPDLPFGASLLILGLIVPLAEEVFFRGCVLTSLTDAGISPTASVILSSAAFAAIHDVRVMPFAFFAGVCLAVTSRACGKGSVIPSFTAHALYNTVLCVISCVT